MRLSDLVTVRPNFQRSVNLERDSETDVTTRYILTSRAVEIVRRWALAMLEPERPRAWSITGPYGSGKSSFALFLEALADTSSTELRKAADRTVRHVDAEVARLIARGRAQLNVGDTGFIRAIATAQREPATVRIMRALRAGARRYWPDRMPRAVASALDSHRPVPSANELKDALRTLSARAPILLVIDEFGKNLEAFADGGAEADLFVLQEIAELISGSSGLPVFLFTLQHLSFADYAGALAERQRREWSKVQGRFEDVPFLDSPDEAVHLIAAALDQSRMPKTIRAQVDKWAKRLWTSYRNLGLADALGSSPDRLAACYPLHPLTTIALPELSMRYAQSSRTLFGFVAGKEPWSVNHFLESAAYGDPVPVVTVEDLYGYFVESSGSMITASGEGSRWLEIDRRIREAQGLTDEEHRCLRTIAILNLISLGGAARASMGAVALTMATGRNPIASTRTGHIVKALEKRGLLTYRAFADEYRIWQGSDFDLAAAIAEVRAHSRGHAIAPMLEQLVSWPPIVAARHSQRTGVFRYLTVRFADETTEDLGVPDGADGLVLYQLGAIAASLRSKVTADGRPTVVVASRVAEKIREAALDLAAHNEVLARPDLAADWVAKRELQDREAVSRQRLLETLRDGFSAANATWTIAATGERLSGKASLTKIASDLCDRIYSATPEVRNEMIARRELTSQGAKARRELLNAMIGSPEVERLGIKGFGPERAMYEAVLFWPGIHRLTEGRWNFQPPRTKSSWYPAWKAIGGMMETAKKRHVSISEMWNTLKSPPVGLKDGPIPTLLTAALLHWADDVAVYQDGTYQPIIDAAFVERLVKTPDRFTIRAFGLEGAREEVVTAVRDVLGLERTESSKRRNATVLSVMSPLVSRLRGLPAFTQHTKRLSAEAMAVRDALRAGREPDALLFEDLPKACGFTPFAISPTVQRKRARAFGEALHATLVELESAYPNLLGAIHDAFVRELRVPSSLSLREDLRNRARHLGSVFEPRIRSPLLMAGDENLDDEDWLEAMAMTIGDRPPQEWRDEEVDQFYVRLHGLASSVERLEALLFARRSEHREGFDARRVTVTSPNGSEVSRVVWIDQRIQSPVHEVAAKAVAEIKARIGPDGATALLSVLAEQLLAEETADETPLKVARLEAAHD